MTSVTAREPVSNTDSSNIEDLLNRMQQLEDRSSVIDALHRFAAGQDLKDWDLFCSAFTANAELDFMQPAQRLGQTIGIFRGRENILNTVRANLARLQTTHTVSNARVELNGDTASLFALVEAQHLIANDLTRSLLLKNFYWLRLERCDHEWRIAHMRIENAWMRGESGVLFRD